MARRLFHFNADNGSGRYRVQVVNSAGVVLVTNGYTFDRTLTGQATQGRIEGFFDNVPVGTVIPAGHQLRTSDLASPQATKLGPVNDQPIIICATVSTCAISSITRSAGTICTNNAKEIAYGFNVNESGDYRVSVIRFDTGAVLAQEIHTATAVGTQAGTLPVSLLGVFPRTGLYVRVENASDPECVLTSVDDLLRIDDTFVVTGKRWTKASSCAAIQRAECTGTYRVVAINCSTGTVLTTQPTDWPIQFISQTDGEIYLGQQGYTETTEPVNSVAPALVCGFGTIRKVAYDTATVYFIAIDQTFSGEPTSFQLLNGDGTPQQPQIGTLVLSQQNEEDEQGIVRPVRYVQLSLLTTTPGTSSLRLRAVNASGSADYIFNVVTISRTAWQLQGIVAQILTPLVGRFNLRANAALTGVSISPQGDCITETATTPITLLSNSNLPSPLTHVGSFPAKKRGFYSLTMTSGARTEALTVTIPAGDGQFIFDSRGTVVPTAKIELLGHYNLVSSEVPTVLEPEYEVSVDVNDCENIQFWIADKNHPEVPATAIIRIDGTEVARVTATLPRTDVRDYLRNKGIQTDAVTFKGVYLKPATIFDGDEHTIEVVAVDGTAARYNVPRATTCDEPVDNTPFVTRRELTKNVLVYEGQSAVGVGTREYLNNGTDRAYSSTATYRFKSISPTGVTLTPVSGGVTVNVTAANNSIDANINLVLEATYPDGGTAETTVQVINTGCTRPAGQVYSPQLVFNFSPGAGQSARTFTSLDDANTTLGKHFDGSAAGQFTPFAAQMANYNVGTPVYVGWGTDCAQVSDNIYYVLNGDKTNGQKIAIQTTAGKIVAVKESTYSSVVV
ncbi:MAG TPA: hypothetical protein VGB67_04035, partial [Fibrella sp.]